MADRVHILASCRNIELVQATLMVFRTLRTGFPTAPVSVWLNEMSLEAKLLVMGAARRVDAELLDIGIQKPVLHHEWIEMLYNREAKPFWILDTDVAFFEACENWKFPEGTTFAGRFTPAFFDEWTKTLHRSRLHTALMWLNPTVIREALLKWVTRFPESWMRPKIEFWAQTYWPNRNGEIEFHDSTAGLWHSIGGQPFTEQQDAAFEHVNCGTYSDLIGPHLSVPNFREKNEFFCVHPEATHGLQHAQREYLMHREVK